MRVGGERSAELVERRHVGADRTAHRELTPGTWLKTKAGADRDALGVGGDCLRRPASDSKV
jgi:hypothetical protein